MNEFKQALDKVPLPKELIKKKRDKGILQATMEKQNNKRNYKPFYAIAVTIIFLFSISLLFINRSAPPENTDIQLISSNYMIDILDSSQVVEFADYVFIAEVKSLGDTTINTYPETSYQVDIIENIKGDLTGTQTLTQYGGFEGNNLFLMEGDDLLQEGSTYLIATTINEENTKTVIPVGGSIKINDEKEQIEITEEYKKLSKG